MGLKMKQNWLIVPSVRREITLELIKRGKTQREISKILQVTEAAVSQYKNSKRGNVYQFSETELTWIQESATAIDRDSSLAKSEITKLVEKIEQQNPSWSVESKTTPIEG